MKSKFFPKENTKACYAIYEDEDGVKKERLWWNRWADRHNYIVEQVKPDVVLIRDSRLNLIKTLTKV